MALVGTGRAIGMLSINGFGQAHVGCPSWWGAISLHGKSWDRSCFEDSAPTFDLSKSLLVVGSPKIDD